MGDFTVFKINNVNDETTLYEKVEVQANSPSGAAEKAAASFNEFETTLLVFPGNGTEYRISTRTVFEAEQVARHTDIHE